MKYKKIILPAILVSSSLLALYGIKNQTTSSIIKPDSKSQGSSSINQSDETNSNIGYQKLSILSNRCRGCGKCARLDSEHFEMSRRVATVISSTNLTSSNLALAINSCPGQAIILE